MRGKVKFFNQSKGYGFIVGDDGKDYFLHRTNINPSVMIDGRFDLTPSDVVDFEPGKNERGLIAVDLRKV